METPVPAIGRGMASKQRRNVWLSPALCRTPTAMTPTEVDSDDVIDESTTDDGVTSRIVRTDTGVRLSIEHTRGSGTRNEDTVKMRVKGKTYEDVADRRRDAIEETVATMEQLREHQPDE